MKIYVLRTKLENIGIFDIDKLTCYVYVYKANNYKITLEEINIKTFIEKNGGNYIFSYLYWHKNIYEKIEFKIYYSSEEKNKVSREKDDVLLKQYLYYSNTIETFHTFNFSSISIKPMIMSSDINEIALIDKKITLNYTPFFCSNKNYIGFLVENIHESKLKIEVYDDEIIQEKIQEEIIGGRKAKEISTEVRADAQLKDIYLKWNLIDMFQCEGKILLSDIVPYYNVNMWKKFSYSLNYQEIEDDENDVIYYKCFFKVKNNQKISIKNVKFQIYIYQSYFDENECFAYNNLIDDKMFVEGCLSLNIEELKEDEEFKYDINIYPLKKEEFNISCILLDKEKKEVYFCPSIINIRA